MRVCTLLPILLAAFLIAGCNPGDNDETDPGTAAKSGTKPEQAPADPGQAAAEPMQAPVKQASPDDWPAWLPPYAGSDMQKAEVVENEFGSGIIAELYSGDGLDEIAAFYQGKLDDAGFYFAEHTVTPIERFLRYYSPNFAVQVAVIRESETTRILLDAHPVEDTGEPFPAKQVRWTDLGELPPGFPNDLLPMREMTKVNSGVLSDDGQLAVVDFMTAATIDELAEFYSAHFTGRGWREEAGMRNETACNIYFYKDGMKITAGIGKYADGQVFASLSYMPEMAQ